MISELQFSRQFTSFWSEVTPTSDQFIRQVNNFWSERFRPPIKSVCPPSQRASISEAASRYFELRLRQAKGRLAPDTEALESAVRWGEERVARFDFQATTSAELDENATQEVRVLAERLEDFFTLRWPLNKIRISPSFPGCGIVDACTGDVLADRTLYEVKAGDRLFRSIDVRQVLTYAALNWTAKQVPVDSIGLINPRLGIFFQIGLDAACEEVGGVAASDLLARISYGMSSGEISR